MEEDEGLEEDERVEEDEEMEKDVRGRRIRGCKKGKREIFNSPAFFMRLSPPVCL